MVRTWLLVVMVLAASACGTKLDRSKVDAIRKTATACKDVACAQAQYAELSKLIDEQSHDRKLSDDDEAYLIESRRAVEGYINTLKLDDPKGSAH